MKLRTCERLSMELIDSRIEVSTQMISKTLLHTHALDDSRYRLIHAEERRCCEAHDCRYTVSLGKSNEKDIPGFVLEEEEELCA